MDSWMPSGLVSKTFSFGAAAESAALAVATASIKARLNGAHLDTAANVVRLATGTDREAVSARSASQCMGTAELIWTPLCERDRCEPRRPRGPVAVPRCVRHNVGNLVFIVGKFLFVIVSALYLWLGVEEFKDRRNDCLGRFFHKPMARSRNDLALDIGCHQPGLFD